MKNFACEEASGYFEPYVDHELPDALRSVLQAHLDGCPECQQRIRALQEVDELGRADFYPEPGEEYWRSVTARIMQKLPEPGISGSPVWETIKSWFEFPALFRPAAYGALTIVLIAIGIRYSGILFKSSGAPDFAANREAGLSVENPTGVQAELPAERDITAGRDESGSVDEKPVKTQAEAHTQPLKKADNKEQNLPYVPKQMTVVPKPPTAEANAPAVEDPLLNRETQNLALENADVEMDELDKPAASGGLQGAPSVRSPRIPQQGTAAFDRGPSQGISSLQRNRMNSKSSKSSTRLSDLDAQYRPKMQGVGSSNLSDSELLQNKIILLEVLETGKDRKIRDVALLQLDGVYQELLSREVSAETIREIKSFYSVYQRELTDALGAENYDKRLERLK